MEIEHYCERCLNRVGIYCKANSMQKIDDTDVDECMSRKEKKEEIKKDGRI